MKTNIISYFYLLLFFASIYAANSTIEGTISDSKTKEHLIGANIMLDGTMLGVASDKNGSYLISNVPIGSYTLKAMFIGYETYEEKIRVEADEKYIIDLALIPSVIELQETKVTGEQRKGKVTGAPASMEIVSSRDIKGKTTTNMGAYLKGLKGIDFTSSGINNYSISVRGFNSSFNTRLLTLSDGRVANIPALRVINYSTIPQSLDDVYKIEVILGPATALYGSNAHSGVVNIISKPPSQSEGLTMSISGSHDERQLRKINGRFSKKLSDSFSIKISGLYLHAYDWPFVSELEYKAHHYPWTLTPIRTEDGKDNNPWNNNTDPLDSSYSLITQKWYIIGNGEQMDTGDPDGDGVMGEDWYNGYDDDGDGLIDEDYFIADGIDNDQDGAIDEWIDSAHDYGYDGVDNDGNGTIDDEAGGRYIEAAVKDWGYNIENNILISYGRRDSLIGNGEINPYYIPNLSTTGNAMALRGNHRFNEDKIKLEFDIFSYDFGQDGLPGDPYEDLSGDGIYQPGESLRGGLLNSYYSDCGLDGLCQYLPENPFQMTFSGIENPDWPGADADGTEGNGIWEPGDGWLDTNENNQVDMPTSGVGDSWQTTTSTEDINNIWPPKNGIWDSGEEIYDCGQDGLCPGDTGYIIADPGEGDGKLVADYLENDGILDTGDELWAFEGEPFIDDNGNKIRDPNEIYTDTNNDGLYNAPDLIDNYQFVADHNGDGLSDYPDFEIDNRKVEFRLDYDPNPDFNLTLQSGYSWTKTQQVTGTGRYIADGFEYTFYQLRGRYKNWFSQFYINQGFSGNTRGYNLGNKITDESKNYAFQAQNNFDFRSLNTKFVWGMDYFRTAPKTFGTILNDGPNGYDNDGDNIIATHDGIDNDLDGAIDDLICPDGLGEGFRNNKIWECGEGIDEPDEFDDPTSNEFGVYYQSTTELFGTSRYELITATRFDYHDLLDEGILFAPKLGFSYKPNSKSSMRLTYGKAHNTPNSITLFTDLFVGSFGPFSTYLRGNRDGTPYCRVGEPCFGSDFYSVVEPSFYSEDWETVYKMGTLNDATYFDGYNERVNGAPYYYKIHPGSFTLLAGDMVPLDTSVNLIFVPELNDDGVLYTANESMHLPDVEPIRTEKIQTLEFGYKGFLGDKTHFSFDAYLSYYEDFFSPPTFITPLVVARNFDEDGNDITTIDNIEVVGLMPVNDIGTHPPYGTAWNGLDDDGDWEEWADEFGWRDDKNGDGNPADPGEWGGVLIAGGEWGGVTYEAGDIFYPHDVLDERDGYPQWHDEFEQNVAGQWIAVGVDELHSTTGLTEYEPVQTGLIGSDGQPIIAGGNASNITDLVLSPMNYGEVWMQGCDVGMTYFLSKKIILDGNVSWYGTTDFYNELTKKNDPINAPKWKWNASIKWNSSLGDVIINFRHVDKFKWSDGIWLGNIGPYSIVDLFYTYHITKNLDFNLSALNLNNDIHNELVGGATMGRQIVMRFTSTF